MHGYFILTLQCQFFLKNERQRPNKLKKVKVNCLFHETQKKTGVKWSVDKL